MPPTGLGKRFICDVPGCEWGPGGTPASYKLAQHLGLHKWHKHGIPGEKSAKQIKARKAAVTGLKKAGSKVRSKPAPLPVLSAADVCMTVLREIAPVSGIPIDVIPAYNEWVRQTEAFLVILLG